MQKAASYYYVFFLTFIFISSPGFGKGFLPDILETPRWAARGIDLRPGRGSQRPISVGSVPFYSISFCTIKRSGIGNSTNNMNSTNLDHVPVSSMRNITHTITRSANGREEKTHRRSLES